MNRIVRNETFCVIQIPQPESTFSQDMCFFCLKRFTVFKRILNLLKKSFPKTTSLEFFKCHGYVFFLDNLIRKVTASF